MSHVARETRASAGCTTVEIADSSRAALAVLLLPREGARVGRDVVAIGFSVEEHAYGGWVDRAGDRARASAELG